MNMELWNLQGTETEVSGLAWNPPWKSACLEHEEMVSIRKEERERRNVLVETNNVSKVLALESGTNMA